MFSRTGSVALLGQEIADAAMGVDVIGVELQRRLEMRARQLVLAGQKQQIRQIDVPGGVFGMMPNGFAEQRPRGVLVAGRQHHGAEIVEHGEIGRCVAEKFEIVALGLFEQALLAQQTGALEPKGEASGSRASERSSSSM